MMQRNAFDFSSDEDWPVLALSGGRRMETSSRQRMGVRMPKTTVSSRLRAAKAQKELEKKALEKAKMEEEKKKAKEEKARLRSEMMKEKEKARMEKKLLDEAKRLEKMKMKKLLAEQKLAMKKEVLERKRKEKELERVMFMEVEKKSSVAPRRKEMARKRKGEEVVVLDDSGEAKDSARSKRGRKVVDSHDDGVSKMGLARTKKADEVGMSKEGVEKLGGGISSLELAKNKKGVVIILKEDEVMMPGVRVTRGRKVLEAKRKNRVCMAEMVSDGCMMDEADDGVMQSDVSETSDVLEVTRENRENVMEMVSERDEMSDGTAWKTIGGVDVSGDGETDSISETMRNVEAVIEGPIPKRQTGVENSCDAEVDVQNFQNITSRKKLSAKRRKSPVADFQTGLDHDVSEALVVARDVQSPRGVEVIDGRRSETEVSPIANSLHDGSEQCSRIESESPVAKRRTRKIRFLRDVMAQDVERIERSGTKEKRRVGMGEMVDSPYVVRLRPPAIWHQEATPFIQQDVFEWFGEAPEDLRAPSPRGDVGCQATCKRGCNPAKCQCILNGIPCDEDFGCRCNNVNCKNERLPPMYDKETHAILTAEANIRHNWSWLSEETTIYSVSGLEIDSTNSRSTTPQTTAPSTPTRNLSIDRRTQIPRSPSPQPIRVNNNLGELDLDPKLFSASYQVLVDNLLNPAQFQSIKNDADDKWLTGEGLFFGLIREATEINREGGKVAVMHPEVFVDFLSGRNVNRDGMTNAIYFRENIETMFIPMNVGHHWSLAVLFVKDAQIVVYDSIAPGKDEKKRNLEILKQMAAVLFPANEFGPIRCRYAYASHADIQNDSYNCGMHCIVNARRILQGRKNLRSKQDKATNFAAERAKLFDAIMSTIRQRANNAVQVLPQLQPCFPTAVPPALNSNHRR